MPKLILSILMVTLCLNIACGEDADPKANNANNTNNTNNVTCTSTLDYYNEQVKPLFTKKCMSCHVDGGLASASMLIFSKNDLSDQATRDAIKAVANASAGADSLLLVKVSGGAGHTGGAQIAADTEDFKKLEALVARIKQPVSCDASSPF